MSKKYTTEEAIQLKKQGIKKINSLLEHLIRQPLSKDDSSTDYTKKAALISKWLEQYANYISFEPKFEPTRNISYQRGDIVFVNFGFGVGSEFGGNHYAVVLDKDNRHNSPSITVIPLSSLKEGKKIHERDVFLGNELYEKMHLKLQTVTTSLREQLSNNRIMLQLIREKIRTSTPDDEISKLLRSLEEEQNELKTYINDAERIKNELLNLKKGSIAKLEQIRTISKIRIYNPRGKRDPLYNIRFSKDTMRKINKGIKELYLFDE